MAEGKDIAGRIYQNLMDAGCDEATAERCMSLVRKGSYSQMLPILSRYRTSLLDKIHDGQKQIDCLDYLIYKIREK